MQVYKSVRFTKAEALTIYAASNEYHPAWFGREDYGYANNCRSDITRMASGGAISTVLIQRALHSAADLLEAVNKPEALERFESAKEWRATVKRLKAAIKLLKAAMKL